MYRPFVSCTRPRRPCRATLLLLVVACQAEPAAEPPFGLPRATPEAVGLAAEPLAEAARVLQAHVDSGRLAGAVLAVAREGRLAHLSAHGVMDLARNEPMRPDALFRICSMSKPVTAVAAMQLVERGVIALDDPIAKFIPSFAATRVYAGGPASAPRLRAPDRPVTVEDLMLHTAGMTYGLFGVHPVDSLYLQANLFDWNASLEQFADRVAALPLMFSPGTRWNYGVGLDVLGRVIEVASGQPFEAYLREHLFGPLGMSETGFTFPAGAEARIPTLYMVGDGGGLVPVDGPICGDYRPDARLHAGGGGLVSTVPDYLRFAQMLLNGGELDGQRVLSEASVRRVMQNHLPPGLAPLPLPEMLGPIGHPGYGQGYGGAVLVDPAATPVPDSLGVYRWLGYNYTFFWVDPAHQLVGTIWAQFLPLGETGTALEHEVQAQVYRALAGR